MAIRRWQGIDLGDEVAAGGGLLHRRLLLKAG